MKKRNIHEPKAHKRALKCLFFRQPTSFSGEIIWHWWDGNDWEIMYYDGNEVKQITDDEEDDLEPSYDGVALVWHKFVEEGGTDIYKAVKNF